MMQHYQFRAMNTIVALEAEGPEAGQAFKAAQDFIEKSEQRFTRFTQTSELSALNHSAGQWFSASPEMTELVEAAIYCYRATNGLFDPSILPDLEAAGYTTSMDQLHLYGASPKPTMYSRKMSHPFGAMEVDKSKNQVRLPAGMQIDLGGIAKGWIAEKAAKRMLRYASTCAVNVGGDIFLIGHPQGQKNWKIILEDPRNQSQDFMTLQVEKGAVATTSVTKRIWYQDDIKRHHLIDPRNGEPAETFWLSVTAFAPTAVLAETFAKAVMIAGPIQAQSLLGYSTGISFLAIDTQGQIWNSPIKKEEVHEYTHEILSINNQSPIYDR